ncbi:uncharacterized protein LOC128231064 [Mya arenaria]|uniref:uncharacterized protein LOC128231064 n=1 Tax=Mya arenaria TaxID=6604 RepID=UPI0022E73E9F|nr:uncharacterized protein LOC128231064 [Mya arenaria]
MGPEAEEIMSSFNLSNENSKKFDTVVEKLNQHFIPKKNVIFERAKFNQRSQMAGESVDSFITELYHLAENCEFRDLHDSLIRDRIVVGIRDHKLSERLQLDPTLSLEKAVTEAKQRESFRAQQAVVRGEPSSTVEAVTRRQHKTQGHRNWKPDKKPVPSTPASRDCQRCGNTPGHPRNKCPAKDAMCRKCQKVGHFQKKCRSTVGAVNEASNTEHSDEDESFLGTVRASTTTDPWKVTLTVNDEADVTFKIDTGADVTVIPEKLFKHMFGVKIQKTNRSLFGTGNS